MYRLSSCTHSIETASRCCRGDTVCAPSWNRSHRTDSPRREWPVSSCYRRRCRWAETAPSSNRRSVRWAAALSAKRQPPQPCRPWSDWPWRPNSAVDRTWTPTWQSRTWRPRCPPRPTRSWHRTRRWSTLRSRSSRRCAPADWSRACARARPTPNSRVASTCSHWTPDRSCSSSASCWLSRGISAFSAASAADRDTGTRRGQRSVRFHSAGHRRRSPQPAAVESSERLGLSFAARCLCSLGR